MSIHYLWLCKWLFHSVCFCDWGTKKDVFCGINFCDVGILWKKCEIYFCDPNVLTRFFSTKSKKEDTIHMAIIYMSFLSRNLLRKNIYTILSIMLSNELFSILKWWIYLCCIFLIYLFNIWSQLLKRYKKTLEENAESISAIGFQTVFCGTYFCDWFIQNCFLRITFLRFRAKITKISSAIISSKPIYDNKKFWAS